MKPSIRKTVPLMAVLVFSCFSAVAGADFAGDLLVRAARYAALEYLGAELSVDGIEGNPLKGFSSGRITLSSKGDLLLSADSLHLKINPRSLLSMKPVISSFSILSADIDGEKLSRHIASLGPLSEDRSIAVQRAEMVNSTVTFGPNRANIGLLGVSFSENAASADIDISVNTVPIRGRAELDLSGGGLAVRSLILRAGKGEIEALGTIVPALSVGGFITGLDMTEIAALWPGVPPGTFRGILSLSFAGEGVWNAPQFSGDLHLESGLLRGIPLDRADARWSFSENRLFFLPSMPWLPPSPSRAASPSASLPERFLPPKVLSPPRELICSRSAACFQP
jgi:translocation and assembly module TamB